MAKGTRVEFDQRARETFLKHLALTGRVQESSDCAGVARTTVWTCRERDEEFAALYEQALDRFRDKLEAEAYRRAVDGWLEPQFGRVAKDQDGEIGFVRKFSDRLLEIQLKGHLPDKYRERVTQDVNLNGKLTVDQKAAQKAKTLTPQEREKRIAELEAKRRATKEPAKKPAKGGKKK